MDCRKLRKVGEEYFCRDHIGGTAVVWATGERFCDPPPDAWHYCAGYHGPQISKDVWVWPKATPRAAQVGAGAKISAESERDATSRAGANTGEPARRG